MRSGIIMAKFCPECAHPIIDGNSQFCPKCGSKLPIISPEMQQPSTQQSVVQPQTQLSSGQHSQSPLCGVCGHTINPGDKYCSKCLSVVKDQIQSTAAPQSQGLKVVIPKEERSLLEWIAICCGGIILLVVVAAFVVPECIKVCYLLHHQRIAFIIKIWARWR